jgi:oxygen-dependent protoporphyrinogen oxidase
MKKVIVVGGGISGLATAYYVARGAKENGLDASVLVLEKEGLPGGKMKTFYEEGFIVEWGPNGFLTNKPETIDLVHSLGIDHLLLTSSDSARKRFVFVDGALKRLPESPGEFFFSNILSVRGRLRVALEPFIRAKGTDGDESLFDFARRRLGVEAAERLIEPMAAGIYAGNPENMSLRSCFPLVDALEREYGGLVKGMMAKMKEKRRLGVEGGVSAGPGGVLMSFGGGVRSLIEEIVARGEFSFRCDCNVEKVVRIPGDAFQVEYACGGRELAESADAVVVSAPAYAASTLIGGLDGELSRLVGDIPYAPIAAVAMGFTKKSQEDVLNAFGFLVPRLEGRMVLGILFDSSIFTNRAPGGSALIRGMIGGARNPDLALLPEGDLAGIMRDEVAQILGIREEPSYIRVYRHEQGIPQYPVGHPGRVEKIRARLRQVPGLFLNNNRGGALLPSG